MRSCFTLFLLATGPSKDYLELLILSQVVWLSHPYLIRHLLIRIKECFTTCSKDFWPRSIAMWALPCAHYYWLTLGKFFLLSIEWLEMKKLHLWAATAQYLFFFLRIHLLNLLFWCPTACLKERLMSCLGSVSLSSFV